MALWHELSNNLKVVALRVFTSLKSSCWSHSECCIWLSEQAKHSCLSVCLFVICSNYLFVSLSICIVAHCNVKSSRWNQPFTNKVWEMVFTFYLSPNPWHLQLSAKTEHFKILPIIFLPLPSNCLP